MRGPRGAAQTSHGPTKRLRWADAVATVGGAQRPIDAVKLGTFAIVDPKTLESFFFGEPQRRLFGALARPRDGRPRAAVVLVNPYGEETVNTYNRLSRWTKVLALEHGIAAFRFHPYGTGESDGTHEDYTLDGAAADLRTAITRMRAECPDVKEVAVLGVRFGAVIALRAAQEQPLDALALWCPVLDVTSYARELLRFKITTEMIHQKPGSTKPTVKAMVAELQAGRTVDIVDYALSPAAYEQMMQYKPSLDAPAKRVLLLARPMEDGESPTTSAAWREKGASVVHQVHKVPVFWEDFTGGLPDPFTQATIDWLLPGSAR